MLRDVEYFISKLSKINGFEDAGNYLASIIKAKEVEALAPSETAQEAETTAADSDAPTEPMPNGEESKAKAAEGTKG